MASFYDSEAYRELAQAVRARDYVLQARIVEEQVATTTGAEQLFWLRVRLARKIDYCNTPRDFANLVPELDTIVSAAQNDPETIGSVASTAILMYMHGEHSDALRRVLPLVRPYRRELATDWGIRHNLGILFVKKRRWHSAFRSFSLSLELYKLLPKARQETQGGYRYFVYCRLAIVAVALKRYDDAATSIAGAYAVMAERPPGYFHPWSLRLAEAALAHTRGEYQTARNSLQTANVIPSAPWVQFDFLLMAARIARSEGNLTSFAHFCQQARALCAEHDMPLSAAAVEAVANGAEY